jgi:predicted  nucleic acid-binding Zn-ribbon protein
MSVKDMNDVSDIIREYYNYDLADEMDKLIPVHTDEEYQDLENELGELYSENADLSDENYLLEEENLDLKDKIEQLEAELEESQN